MKPEDRPGYGGAAIALHWLTAVLVVVVFTLGPGGSETRVYPAAKDFGPSPRWMRVASRVVQGLLYLLLFAVPLTAIAGAWLEGHPLTLGALGLSMLPARWRPGASG